MVFSWPAAPTRSAIGRTVHPGPADTWAGGRTHSFAVLFGLKAIPTSGQCKLHMKLVDTHYASPPLLKVRLNQVEKEYQLPKGASDEAINGQPAKGRAHSFELVFPATALKQGLNELTITTAAGSWMLYDSVGFETPPGAELGAASGTMLSATSPPFLVRRNDRLAQVAKIVVRHLGDQKPVVLRVGELARMNLVLQNPIEAFEVPLLPVEKETKVMVSLQSGDETLASRELTLKPVRKWTVYLLPHSHVDIGYTHVQADVERKQWSNLETGIEAARKSAAYPKGSAFKWNTEVLWAVDSYLKQASPEKQKDFYDAVKAGWVGLDALYGNELTGLCRPEELLRLVALAGKLGNRTGVPIQSAMITDVPGYTWGMVPTFAQAGVKYFSIGPNGADRIGHTIAAWGDKPFWWIGPNGRDKVLVWMTGSGYYRAFQSAEGLQQYLAGLSAKGYPYDMVQVRHCLGDNGAPDVNFADTVKQWNEKYAYPRLVIATTAEMFHDFEKAYGDKLPVAKGDFTPYWEDGAASSARETALNRSSADRLTQAETLFAMLNPKGYPAEEFGAAWRNVVLYDEHTWGAHNSISEPDAPFVKSQWAVKQAFALNADQQSRKLLHEALAGNELRSGNLEAIDVFNTTSWTRTDLVTIPAEARVAGDGVRGPHGETVASQRLSTGELVFLAKDVPGFGANRYTFGAAGKSAPARARAEGLTLTSWALNLRIDETTGAISSLRSRRCGEAELVDSAESGLNDYLYLPGIDVKGVQRSGPVQVSVRETGPLVASLLVKSVAPGCNSLTREYRVIDGLDRIDIINTLDKKAVRAKEGVHFGFGFDVPEGVVRMDVPWAVVRPEADQIPGACKNWYTVQRWVDVSNDRFGVSWATPDAPLVEIGAITANLLGALSDPRNWMDHIEPSGRIYSWAMNNHWHTNYRAEQDGPTVFRYSIWPHKLFKAEQTAKFGTECSQPLIPAVARNKAVPAPLLRVTPESVLVTAMKPSEDGKAWIVRLFGASGKTQAVKLNWNKPVPKRVLLSTWQRKCRGHRSSNSGGPGVDHRNPSRRERISLSTRPDHLTACQPKSAAYSQGVSNPMKHIGSQLVLLSCCLGSMSAAQITAPEAKLEKLAGDFVFTEGPASDRAGNVLFTDQPNDRIVKWGIDGKLSTWKQPCGRANGLSFDAKGNLWACADEKNELWRIDPAGKVTVVVKDYQGKLLNGPNDLWLRPAGGLYFTDPYYKRSYWKRGEKEMPECVYFLKDDYKTLERVIDDLKQPNGIIGTPDGKLLYVADIGAKKTYRYQVQPDGSLTGKKLFCEMGSDGFTIDNEGNLYLTGNGVFVFDNSGNQIQHLEVPENWTANVCFGGKDRDLLFITASKGLYAIKTRVKGVDSQ